eukprot:10460635-Alexandrium_andersonii.AAC.1
MPDGLDLKGSFSNWPPSASQLAVITGGYHPKGCLTLNADPSRSAERQGAPKSSGGPRRVAEGSSEELRSVIGQRRCRVTSSE